MAPLDLRLAPPRGPRERLANCTFMARTVDKLRAQLPGGNIGMYILDGPGAISGYVLHKLHLDVDTFRAVVANAKDEAAVEAWLVAHVAPAAIEAINVKLEGARIDHVSPEQLRVVYERHPILHDRSDLEKTFALLEADDAAVFAR